MGDVAQGSRRSPLYSAAMPLPPLHSTSALCEPGWITTHPPISQGTWKEAVIEGRQDSQRGSKTFCFRLLETHIKHSTCRMLASWTPTWGRLRCSSRLLNSARSKPWHLWSEPVDKDSLPASALQTWVNNYMRKYPLLTNLALPLAPLCLNPPGLVSA